MPGGPYDIEMPRGGFASPIPRLPSPEIIAAINALTKEDFSKLHLCAAALIYRIRYLTSDKNADDLLNEAIVRTLNSDRNWKPERVSFVPYLIRCMESIVDHWRKQYLKFPSLAPFDEHATSSDSSFPAEFHARGHEEALRSHFKGDDEAWQVLDLRMDGRTPAEIREELKLSLHAYHAAAKRGRRKAQAFLLEQLQTSRKKHPSGSRGFAFVERNK